MASFDALRTAMTLARDLVQGLDADVVKAARVEVEEQVVEWRWADSGADPHRPEPWFGERQGGTSRGGWKPERPELGAKRIGIDALGRPVIVELRQTEKGGWLDEVWRYDGDAATMVSFLPMGQYANGQAVVLDDWRRPTLVTRSAYRGTYVWVEEWDWAGDVPVAGRTVEVGEDGVDGTVWRFDVDGAGQLERVQRAELRGVLSASEADDGDDETGGDLLDIEAALAADGGLRQEDFFDSAQPTGPADKDAGAASAEKALDVIRTFDSGKVVWDYRLQRPEPMRPTTDDLEGPLTAGLHRALVAAVEASGVDRPFAVKYGVSSQAADGPGPLPGFLRIGSERFRNESRKLLREDGAALDRLYTGQAPDVVQVDLAATCDDATLQACREVNTAVDLYADRHSDEARRGRAALAAVGAGLAASLNEPGVFGEVAEPFLAVVRVEDATGRSGDEAFGQTAAAVGGARIARFRESIASVVGTGAHVGAGGTLDARRTSREALGDWLESRHLPDARLLAEELAEPGFRLVTAADGEPTPNSRLHGPGLLPPGEAWPRKEGGRALGFLAAIDLAELTPVIPGGPTLPSAGWLLFFADLDDHERGYESEWYGEEVPNEPGSPARILWVAPGDAPVTATAPDDGEPRTAVDAIPVRGVHHLTLVDGWGAGEALGLRSPASEAYDEITETLRFGDGDESGSFDTQDWVLGSVTGVQGHEPDSGTALLLHLASVEFQDGGALQFRIPRDALAAQDWSRAYVQADSG